MKLIVSLKLKATCLCLKRVFFLWNPKRKIEGLKLNIRKLDNPLTFAWKNHSLYGAPLTSQKTEIK